ncbi:MAG: PilN domain-containing protein [Armatimonadetes bacterium]|nr:PilN domain-containing protein [Armatimonadota bacterium]
MTIKVDLRPTEKPRGVGLDGMTIILFILILIVAGGCWFYNMQLEGQVKAAEKQLADVQAERENYKSIRPRLEQIKKETAKLDEDIRMMRSLRYDPLKFSELLVEVGVRMPQNVWLSSLTIDSGTQQCQLGGYSLKTAQLGPLRTIADLLQNLLNSRYFSDVYLVNASEAKIGGRIIYNFQLDGRITGEISVLRGGGPQ